VGDRVQVSTPTGTFAIPAELDLPVVLIAAGVGITPFMSYLETLATRGSGTDVTLLYSSRDAAHHVFKERIAALAAELPNLRVVNFYTRPGAMDRLGVDHQVAGRMSASDIDQQLIDRRARFYVCATDTMMREVRQGLVSRGVPGFDIFQERFVSPVPTLVIPEDAVHTVRLARSDRELTWRKADGSLLALAEQAGVSMPGGCRVGQCENCTVRVLSGTVQYLQDEVDIGDGDSCLTCQAVPSSDVVLDI
jgi:ferredoxin-NADP reductase